MVPSTNLQSETLTHSFAPGHLCLMPDNMTKLEREIPHCERACSPHCNLARKLGGRGGSGVEVFLTAKLPINFWLKL